MTFCGTIFNGSVFNWTSLRNAFCLAMIYHRVHTYKYWIPRYSFPIFFYFLYIDAKDWFTRWDGYDRPVSYRTRSGRLERRRRIRYEGWRVGRARVKKKNVRGNKISRRRRRRRVRLIKIYANGPKCVTSGRVGKRNGGVINFRQLLQCQRVRWVSSVCSA